MEKYKNDESPIRIFKPTGAMQFIIAIAVIFIVIHFSFLLQLDSEDAWVTLCIIPLYGWFLWSLILSSTQNHLAIYENGLEYRMGNHRVFSRWEDLKRFESRSAGKSRILGLYAPALEIRQEASGLERFLSNTYKDFIPLSIVGVPTRWDGCWTGAVVDTVKLAETDFGRELAHYAPHLFEPSKEKSKHGNL